MTCGVDGEIHRFLFCLIFCSSEFRLSVARAQDGLHRTKVSTFDRKKQFYSMLRLGVYSKAGDADDGL